MTELFKKADKPSEDIKIEVKKNEDGSFDIGGKHYKDTDALLESKVHADKHIETVLSEKRRLEQDVLAAKESATKVDDLGSKLDMFLEHGYRNTTLDTDLEGDSDNMTPTKPETSTVVSAEDVAKMVKDGIQQGLKPLQDQLLVDKQQSKFRNKLIKHYDSEEAATEAYNAFKEKGNMTEEFIQTLVKVDADQAAEMITSTMVVNSEPKSGEKPDWKKVPGSGYTGTGRETKTDAKPQTGFKEMVQQLKNNSHQWTTEKQNQMSEDFDKYGVDYFKT